MEAERPDKVDTDRYTLFREAVLTERNDIPDEERDRLRVELYRQFRNDTRSPDEVLPPLSAVERHYVVDSQNRLRWTPAKYRHEMKLKSRLQRQAYRTGGLVMTGTSGTMYRFLWVADQMRSRWGVQVDVGLLRLAFLAILPQSGHHTFHEIMLAAEMFDPTLWYSDNWERYRRIAPLTERELRRHVARNGKFPHELAREAFPDPPD